MGHLGAGNAAIDVATNREWIVDFSSLNVQPAAGNAAFIKLYPCRT